MHTGTPHFIVLHFIVLRRCCVFLQIEGVWQPCTEQVCLAIFPAAFAHFVSLCHVLVILKICQTLSLLLHLSW